MRPALQQQLQKELAAAGITSTMSGGDSSSSTQYSRIAANGSDQDGATAAAGDQAADAAGYAAALHQRLERLLDVFAAGGPDLLKQLPLLQACLNEAMRLYPAGAPGAPRC